MIIIVSNFINMVGLNLVLFYFLGGRRVYYPQTPHPYFSPMTNVQLENNTQIMPFVLKLKRPRLHHAGPRILEIHSKTTSAMLYHLYTPLLNHIIVIFKIPRQHLLFVI